MSHGESSGGCSCPWSERWCWPGISAAASTTRSKPAGVYVAMFVPEWRIRVLDHMPDPKWRAAELAAQGYSDTAIGGVLGVASRTVLRWRKEMGVPSRYRETHKARHGIPSTYNAGCRCQPCRDAHKVRTLNRSQQRRKITEAGQMPATVQHGSSAYKNWGCRCDICAAAHKEQCARLYALRVERGLPEHDARHGTTAAYNGWGCRCERCVEAAADARPSRTSSSSEATHE